jgi:hypothetical protein
MDSSNVLEMIRPFDPLSPEAEDHYDTVARRVNRVRSRRARLGRELTRIENQFLDNGPTGRSGSCQDGPPSKGERRERLARPIELGTEIRQLDQVERFSVAALGRMNTALDRWARETYGQEGS